MAGSTWNWTGGTGASTLAANWALISGSGNASHIPLPGDVILEAIGVITDGLDALGGAGFATISNLGTVAVTATGDGITLGGSPAFTGGLAVSGTAAVVSLGASTTGMIVGGAGTGFVNVQSGGSVLTPVMALGGGMAAPGGGTGGFTATGSSHLEVTTALALWAGSTLSVDATSGVDIGGANTYAAGAATIENGASLIGDGTIAAAVVDNGVLAATNTGTLAASTGGDLVIAGPLDGTGQVSIEPGATLQLGGTLGANLSVNFAAGTPETLILGSPSGTIATFITNFAIGDKIELSNGLIVTGATLGASNPNLLTIGTRNTAGVAGSINLTNVKFAPNANATPLIGFDPVTLNYYASLTREFIWIGNAGSLVTTAGNWSINGQAPGGADSARFDLGSGGTIGGVDTVQIAFFMNSGTWTLAPGTSLTANTAFNIGGTAGGTQSLGNVVAGPGSTIGAGDSIDVGAFAGDVSTLTVAGGGIVRQTVSLSPTQYELRAGAAAFGTLAASTGSVAVTGTGSVLNLPFNGVELGGAGGTGALSVAQGGSVIVASGNASLSDALSVGRLGSGSVTVTDRNSEVLAAGPVEVARTATGVLTVQNTAIFLTTPDPLGHTGIVIGAGGTLGTGGAGIANVNSGGQLISQGSLVVGSEGTTGLLNVNNGTVTAATMIREGVGGTFGPGNGAINVVNSGSTATALALTGPAQTASYGVLIGDSDSGIVSSETAAATISGPGAVLNTNGNGLAVGYFGTAVMTVEHSASVTIGSANDTLIAALSLGRLGAGTLTVTDPGTALVAHGGAAIGQGGTGLLLVQNSAIMSVLSDAIGDGYLDIGGAGPFAGSTLVSGGAGAARVTSGADLFSQTNILVGDGGDAGTLTVDNAGTAEAARRLSIGNAVSVAAGGVVITTAGTAVVTNPTSFAGGGQVTVGPGGHLLIDGGQITTAGTAALVIGGGAPGGLTVSGAGAVASANGNRVDVGAQSQGGLTIAAGGTLLAGTKFAANAAVEIGVSTSVSGAVVVSDPGSSLQAAGQIDVGVAGTGALVIQNQATVRSGGAALAPSQGIEVGQQAGSIGTIAVTGTRSLLSNTGAFVVGDAAVGVLTVQAGGTVITSPGSVAGLAGMVVGNAQSSQGSVVNVAGAGSTLSVGGRMDVGIARVGSLQLSNGASVTAGALDGGISASGVAVISVSGAGTSLAVTGDAMVADGGTGVLSVLSGASFSAADLTIGNLGSSSGALIVSGSGSTVRLSGDLNIGTALGNGDLTVGPGAVVHAAVVNLQGQVVLEGGVLDPTVNNIGQGQTLGGFGTIVADQIIDGGVIEAGGSNPSQKLLLVQGTVLGGSENGTAGAASPVGLLRINAGGTMELTGPVLNAASTTFKDSLTLAGSDTVTNSVVDVSFADATGVLLLDDIGGFGGTIASFSVGDQFVITGGTLSNINVINNTTLSFADAGPNAGGGQLDRISFGAPISAGQFTIVGGNTVQAVSCFTAGTRVETETGPVAVEQLRIGDRVMTADGRVEPVIWIGQRAVDCRRHPRPETVWPVRIATGAFGRNVPRRDLYLSPDHAVFVDDVLVPVKYLINGTTIVQVERSSVAYYHVELPYHELILANGLRVESYLNLGFRPNFHDDTVVRLFPVRTTATNWIWDTKSTAPLVIAGQRLDMARRSLGGRGAGRQKPYNASTPEIVVAS
jgi:T5SS/PEP-CTERM-associated repeat protein